MGESWYSCKYCNESFSDYEDDWVSCNCRNRWCSSECAEEDGYEKEHCKLGYDTGNNKCEQSCYGCDNFVERSCKYCRQEDFDDEVLLNYALKMLDISRRDLIEVVKMSK